MTLKWNQHTFSYELVTESPSSELLVYEFLHHSSEENIPQERLVL
jgi:hypothetical protein